MAPSGWAHPANAISFTEHDFSFEESMDDENDLKVEINTFVWSHAPADMPLGKADELACKIFELMIGARQEYGESNARHVTAGEAATGG